MMKQTMKTEQIQVKIDPELKRQAQEVAEELGLSLSGIIRAQLIQMIRNRELVASAEKFHSSREDEP